MCIHIQQSKENLSLSIFLIEEALVELKFVEYIIDFNL
ncbi:Uncharacterised protein [Turicibacter sanguinis]|nr:Uncharacterised protein [Turicibacter sanguinis]